MGTQHLDGKRTGRPPGARSRLPWIRDLRWAYRNLDKPDPQPPTAFAGLLLAMGREHPERLVPCLAIMDMVRLEEHQRNPGIGDASGDASANASDASEPASASVSAATVPKPGRHLVVYHGLREPVKKFGVVRALLDVVDVDLNEAFRLVDRAPVHIKNLTREQALRIHDKLSASGALVSVQEDRSRSAAHR
jgi:ribosomal protein L7/L12